MCKLLIGANTEPDNKEFAKVITAQFDSMRDQPNGIGAFVITFDGKLKVIRNYSDYDGVFTDVSTLLPTARVVGLHTRISTGGTLGLTNTHFFEDNGYLLAHNGTVSKFSTYGLGYQGLKQSKYLYDTKYEDEIENENQLLLAAEDCYGCMHANDGFCKKHKKFLPLIGTTENKVTDNKVKVNDSPCDSLQFLRTIPKPVTVESLDNYVEETHANNSMMVLVEKETKKVMVVVKKPVHSVTDRKTFGVFFSWEPTLKTEKEEWLNLMGIPVFEKKTSTKLNYKPRKVSYGTFELKY